MSFGQTPGQSFPTGPWRRVGPGSGYHAGGGTMSFAPSGMEFGSHFGTKSGQAKNYLNTQTGQVKNFAGGFGGALVGVKKQTPIGEGKGFLDQAAQALSGDMNALQAASDDQYAAIQGEIGKQEGFIDSATAELKAMGEDQAAAIGAEADELKGVADAAYGDVKGQVGKADELAAQATEEFRKVKSEYKDLAAQNASTAAFSIGRSAQQQRMQIQGGLRPDGTQMSPAEQQASMAQLGNDVRNQTQAALTPLLAQQNQMQAQLGSQVAASIQAQAQIAGQGAQTVTQAGAVQAQTRQAAAALQTQAQNYRSAGLLAATQMEFNGRQAIAGLIQNNPRGVISKFAGFAALLQMGTIPGIVNATPVSEGLLT